MVPLESSKLFSELPAAELKKLREDARELTFPAGGQIFREGDPSDGIYVVRAGQVQISAVVGEGERRALSRVLPGDVFGEMTLLDSAPRSAGASAEGETTVFFVPREPMVEALKRSPGLALQLAQEISARLREFNRQYIRELLQAERMALVGRFASSIVHDLKNPLTIINIAADLACLETATAEMRQVAQERIARQVDRITAMLNDILEFTRGTPAAPLFTQMDYGRFAQALIEELQREVSLKSVVLECENPPPSVKIPINPARLTRVFYNLILNAVDAMPDGGKIKLRFQLAGQEIVTEIEDSGRGIAPQVADHLFEPFATYGKTKGTGLGLSICQRIVEEHRGRITARNQPGGGAVFRFTLPC